MRLIDEDDYRGTLNIRRSCSMEIIKWALDGAIKDLDDAPTIDPVKHGHWEDLRIYGNFCRGICSVCKNVYVVSAWCGNCGAYMDEEVRG